MFGNISAPLQYESTSDYGAKRILGMGGSLMGYIQTGNAYNRRYYHKTPSCDTFNKRNSKKRFDKIITALVAGVGIIGSVLLFAKGKGKNLADKISKINYKKIDFKNFKLKIPSYNKKVNAQFGKYSAKTKQQSGLAKLWLNADKFNLPKK